MGEKENDFLRRLLAVFRVEAQEHISVISPGLIELEKELPPERQAQIVETIFREAHSLKGAARAVNMTEIERVCQSLENVFAGMKRGETTLSQPLFDALHDVMDIVNKLLLSIGSEIPAEEKSRVANLIQQLESTAQGVPPVLEKQQKADEEIPSGIAQDATPPLKEDVGSLSLAEETIAFAETVRIPAAKLESLLLQTEELLSAKLTAAQRATELRNMNAALVTWKKEWAKVQPHVRSIRHSLERNVQRVQDSNGALRKLVEFLELNENFTDNLQGNLDVMQRSAEHDQRSLGAKVNNLVEDMRKVMMLPFSYLTGIFPKIVRDLARAQGKEVDLVIHGADCDIDRRILEEIKDPCIHIVRNCIDHGIEKPETRKQKGKTARGTITIAIALRESNKVEMLVSDDGAGIHLDKVRTAALKLGIASQEEIDKMDDRGALSLIFRSGISTSPIITDISGRGLGLAIAQEKAEKLGGTLSVETRSDVGTTFRMVLPSTLATFRGILVRVGERRFVLPTANVDGTVRIPKEEIKTVENRETISLNGQAVSFARLENVLGLATKSVPDDLKIQAAIVRAGEKYIAFAVDEVLNEQEVPVKSLGRQLRCVPNISGAALLGTGEVVPILNVPDLIKSAVKAGVPVKTGISAPESKAERESILVVEDSITARTLVKNILETAGYNVKTAVDGVDGFTALRSEEFNLVVSDVDMPRMSGFELTAKIRADKKLAETPVVLVTALESREDRERGIDVGANAYIVKSSFDQSNLLEAIRRLI